MLFFKGDLRPDFGVFQLDEFVIRIPMSMDLGKNFKRFCFTTMIDKPTGGLGEPN